MATADLLLEQMFSWIKQRELCAKQLRKLAQELESLREKCNGGECVGSSAAVVGAVSLIGAGAFALFTGGAAVPFLAAFGAASSGVGLTISVAAKLTEHFLSGSTMKEAQKIEEESNKVSDKIQKLFQQLKAEVKKRSPSADPDELDRHIMAEILRAMGRRSGLKGEINVPQFYFDAGPRSTGLNQSSLNPEVMVGLAGILTFFSFEGSGKEFNFLFAKGAKLLFKKVLTTGFKTVLRGGAKAVGGAVGLVFSLPEAIDDWKDLINKNNVTEASQSLRDTADDLLKINRTLREQLDNIRQKLKTLAEVKLCIENSNRSSEQKQKLIEFAKEHSEDGAVVRWLRANSESEAFFKLVDMFCSLKDKLNEEKKKIDCSEDLHITFVAHGAIEASLIPASCLLPLPSIRDVLLYSPWNCSIDAAAAYGVATGRIRPQHRRFSCKQEKGFQIPDERHQLTNLPRFWNSMKKAGGQKIPNILVSTLKKPEDGAWEGFMFLTDKSGQPERNRVVVPFILPGRIGSSVTVPFSVVTLALSLVLAFSRYKATVHLAACLSKTSAATTLNEADLKEQYACTVDHTVLTASQDILVHRDSELYRALKAVFG